MTDRITPFDEAHRITERIDEIVVRAADVHFEMMGQESAVMFVGDHRFVLFAERDRLVVKWTECDDDARQWKLAGLLPGEGATP